MGCGASTPEEPTPPAPAPAPAPEPVPPPVVAKVPRTAKEKRAAKQLSEVEELCEELMRIAKAIEPKLTESLLSVAVDEDGKLEGLDFRFKTRESLVRKATGDFLQEREKFFASQREQGGAEPKTMEEVVFSISDAVRYTVIFRTEGYTKSVKSTLKTLEKVGYKKLKVKNFWAEGDTYQGINTQFGWDWTDDKTGSKRLCRVEIQFHTPESFETKMRAHVLYEAYRTETNDDKKLDLYRQMQAVANEPPFPPDVQTIPELCMQPPPELYKQWAARMKELAEKEKSAVTKSLTTAIGSGALKDSGGAVHTEHEFFYMLREAFRHMPESTTKKMTKKQQVEAAAANIEQSLVYEAVYPENMYWKKTGDAVQALQEQGYAIASFKNYWIEPKDRRWTYKAFHVTFTSQNDVKFECRFHTPDSYKIMDSSIDEQWDEARNLSGKERTMLNIKTAEIWEKAHRPVGEQLKLKVGTSKSTVSLKAMKSSASLN